MNLFAWKGVIFSSSTEASKLKVNWFCPSFNSKKRNERARSYESSDLDLDQDVVESSDHERDFDFESDHENNFTNQLSHRDKHFSPRFKNSAESNLEANNDYQPWVISSCDTTETNLDLDLDLCVHGHENGNIDLDIIAEGFTYDPHSSIRVPVFLIKVQGKDNPLTSNSSGGSHENKSRENLHGMSYRLVLVSLLDCYEPQNVKCLLETFRKAKSEHSGESKSKTSSHKKSFKLFPLQTFWIENDTLFESPSLQRHIAFVSNYGFVHVKCVPAKISIYFGTSDSEEKAEVQHFSSCDHNMLDKCTILQYQLYNCFESQAFVFVALVEDMNDDESESSKSCVAFYFCPSQPFSKKFVLKYLQSNKYFPQKFSQILLRFTILSTSISNNDANVSSSSVILVTTTGFAVRFLDGEMMHCVHLSCSIENFDPQRTRVHIIHIDDEQNQKSFVCVNDTCDIVHWPRMKILSSYSNVSFISKFDILCNGHPSILLLLYPDESGPKSELSVHDLHPLIIDEREFVSNDDKKRSFQSLRDQSSSVPQADNQQNESVAQNVLKNLICQEKKCQSELREAQQAMDNKTIFIENLQRKFSNELSVSSQSSAQQLYLQPLIPLTEESLSTSISKNRTTSYKESLKCGQSWRRIIHSFLICGMEVTNISRTSQVSEMYLTLLPLNPSLAFIRCASQVANQISPLSFQAASPVRKKMCLEKEVEEGASALADKLFLGPNESATLLTCTDISQIQRGEDVIFKVSVAFQLKDEVESKTKTKRQSVFCEQFSLSLKDTLSESFSLKSRLQGNNGGTLNKEDILALDCVQKCFDLEVKSVMTSVLSLKSELQLSSLMHYISWADQYIISSDHMLRYCRIKWLNQRSKCEAKIRVFAGSQTDVILLVQLMYSLVPKDITITLPDNSQPSVSAIKTICQSLVDKVHHSVTEVEKYLCQDKQQGLDSNHGADKKDEKGVQNITEASTLNDQGEMVVVTNDKEKEQTDEVFDRLPKSPTFQSSARRRVQTFHETNANINVFPSTSRSHSSKDFKKINSNSRVNYDKSNTHDKDEDSYKPTTDTTMTREPVNDFVKSKGTSRKGGPTKGKGKLMMKR